MSNEPVDEPVDKPTNVVQMFKKDEGEPLSEKMQRVLVEMEKIAIAERVLFGGCIIEESHPTKVTEFTVCSDEATEEDRIALCDELGLDPERFAR